VRCVACTGSSQRFLSILVWDEKSTKSLSKVRASIVSQCFIYSPRKRFEVFSVAFPGLLRAGKMERLNHSLERAIIWFQTFPPAFAWNQLQSQKHLTAKQQLDTKNLFSWLTFIVLNFWPLVHLHWFRFLFWTPSAATATTLPRGWRFDAISCALWLVQGYGVQCTEHN